MNFSNALKYIEVFPGYKKKNHLDKENYESVSILPHLCEIYER